jgi:hypothetical protein
MYKRQTRLTRDSEDLVSVATSTKFAICMKTCTAVGDRDHTMCKTSNTSRHPHKSAQPSHDAAFSASFLLPAAWCSMSQTAAVKCRRFPHRVQCIQHVQRVLPRDARVGDRDAVLEGSRALGRDVLPARVDVRLDHDARNRARLGRARRELLADVRDDLGLVPVVLIRVPVCRAVSVCRAGGGKYIRLQSIMILAARSGRFLRIAPAAAATCSAA